MWHSIERNAQVVLIAAKGVEPSPTTRVHNRVATIEHIYVERVFVSENSPEINAKVFADMGEGEVGIVHTHTVGMKLQQVQGEHRDARDFRDETQSGLRSNCSVRDIAQVQFDTRVQDVQAVAASKRSGLCADRDGLAE